MTQLSTVCGASPINKKILFFDGYVSKFYDRSLFSLEYQNIKPSILVLGNSGNDHPNNNSPNMKLKWCYNETKSS